MPMDPSVGTVTPATRHDTPGPASHLIIAYLGWPFLVLATGTAYVWSAYSFGGLTPLTFLVITSAAFIFSLAMEMMSPYRDDWRTVGDPSFARDIGHTALTTAFGERLGLLMATPIFALFGYAFTPGTDSVWNGFWPHGLPMAAQIAAAVLLAETLDYWRHRLEHEVSFLWPLHFVHHSADRLNTIKSSRNNLADLAARFIFSFVPLLLLGAPLEFILWHGAAVTMFGIPAHSNANFRIPHFLHRLVLTPHVHRIHHMADMIKGNSNYANLTPLLDQLFGTYTAPTDQDHLIPAGVLENPLPRSFLAEMFAPLLWPLFSRRSTED